MGFCQWFRHFSDRINVLMLLKLKLIVLVFKQHSSQSQKMVFIRLLTIKGTSGMNWRIPPAFGQNLSIYKGRLQKSNHILKTVHYK